MSSLTIIRRAGTLAFVSLVAACGGGGGGGSPPPPPVDTQPNAFALPARSDVAPGVDVDSATVTISGINAAASISITGGNYSVNGAAFTSNSGTVSNGDRITVRVTSASVPAGQVSATLTVGGFSATFDVATVFDAIPDDFAFAERIDVAPSSEITSDPVVIGGIDVPVAVTITGGQYSIDGGAFTSAAGEITVSQSIVLRLTSSALPSTLTSATVTIGGVEGTFDATTMPDLIAPEAVVGFPPLVSLTGGPTVAVRGTATDDFFVISRVSVNGTPATSTDGFASWAATVPLTPGANTVLIETEDGNGNVDPSAVELTVTRNARLGMATSLAMDPDNDRLLVLDTAADSVFAVALATGLRTIVSDDETPNGNFRLSDPTAVLVDEDRDRALVLEKSAGVLLAADLSTGARTVVSGNGIPDLQNGFVDAYDMAFDRVNDRLLVLNHNGQSVLAVDLDTGARTVVSNNVTPDFANFFYEPTAIAVDEAGSRALVANEGPNQAIYAVDLTTGARTILSDAATPDATNPLGFASAIVVDPPRARALVAQPDSGIILAVDLATGARTVFSSPTVPDAVNPLLRPWSLRLDLPGNRLLVLDQDLRAVIAVNLVTGARTIVSASELGNSGAPLDEPRGIALDPQNGRALISADGGTDAVLAVDLATAVRTVVSSGSQPNADEAFLSPIDLVADLPSNRVFVLDQGESGVQAPRVIAVDLATGVRTLLSGAAVPDAGNALGVPIAIDLDSNRSRLLVADADLSAVVAVNIGSGARTILSDNSTPDGLLPFAEIEDVLVHAAGDRSIAVSALYLGSTNVLGIDLGTGARSEIAAFNNPFGPQPDRSARRLTLDAGGNRIFVIRDTYYHELDAIDLGTGLAMSVSMNYGGNATNPLSAPGHMAYDPETSILYLVADDFDALMAVDTVTGLRVFISR